MKRLLAYSLLFLFVATVAEAQPYVYHFDFRVGDALTLENVYKDVDANGVETPREWTTEVIHFTVYNPVGTQNFTKNSSDDPTIVVLTDGFYSIDIDEGDSDLTSLSVDSTYYWYEIDEVDTDGRRHTRVMGQMYMVAAGGFPVAGVTSGVGILLGTGGVNITIATTGASGYTQVLDEASNITQRSKLNFTGSGVSCADDATNFRTNCTISSGGGSGTMTTVKDTGVQVGGADIVTLDFGNGLDVSETPDTEANISVNAGELEAGLEAVMDLQDMQGAVTDAQVPDNITIDITTDTAPGLGGNLDAGGNNITSLGDVTFKTGAAGGTLRTGTSAADKFQIQAYDVDNTTYRTLLEADAGNDVVMQLFTDYFQFEDATDNTKIAKFDASGITTGTTRTFTFPDASGTLSTGSHTTNTNASTICNGSTTVLDGDGNCDDLSAIYQPLDADLTDLADGSLTGTKVGFADTNGDYAATDVQSAIEELVTVNGSGVNAADGKVEWSQLVGVPAGFADGTDDGAGGSGDEISVNGLALANANFTDSTEIALVQNRTATPDEVSLHLVTGSIANAKLTNSSVSYGGIALSLGGTDATPAFDLTDATNYPFASLTGSAADGQLPAEVPLTDEANTYTAIQTFADSTVVEVGIRAAVTGSDPIISFSDGVTNISRGALQVGGVAVQTGADDDVPESGDFGAAADLEADGSLSNDVVAAAEMADADHGDVSWTTGVATVENVQCTGCIADSEVDDGITTILRNAQIQEESESGTTPTIDSTRTTITLSGNTAATVNSNLKVANEPGFRIDISNAGGHTFSLDGTDIPIRTGSTVVWCDYISAALNCHTDMELKTYALTIEDPTNAEDISLAFTNEAITVREMRAVLIGSATPSVTWTIRHNSDRSAAGAEVVTSGTTTTSTTTGSDVTSFNDATIPADSFVWLETTAQSGTVTELHVTIIYYVD